MPESGDLQQVLGNKKKRRAVVVAQLIELSFPILEVRSLNLVIGKNLFILNICFLSIVYWKDENREKEAGNDPFLKKHVLRTVQPT